MWTLLQVVVDLILALGLVVAWFRLKRPPQDDPRLSRGLQLLQSKISVLEDLADRTDNQVKQLTTLIDQKTRLLQTKIIESEHQIQRIEQSMIKSREVAEIFQDRIPHEEVRQRQETIKYVKAAQMAHAGRSAQEIAMAVDLPIGQIEMIAKVNRDHLVFDPEALPEWAKSDAQTSSRASALREGLEFQLHDKLLIDDEASNFDHEASNFDHEANRFDDEANKFAGEVFQTATNRASYNESNSSAESHQSPMKAHSTLLSTAVLTSALTSSGMAESRAEESDQLHRLGQEFRQALHQAPVATSPTQGGALSGAVRGPAVASNSKGQTPLSNIVKRVQFPKVTASPANSTPILRG